MTEEYSETYIEIALNNRLRTHVGTAFQRFFSDIMAKIHKDFVRVKPQGSLGDEGVDGCFMTGATIHQCYGADNGHVQNAKQAAKKILKDFETVRKSHPEMRKWLFTHNLVDGLPMDFVKAMKEAQAIGQTVDVEVGLHGVEEFLRDIRLLKTHERANILGTDAYHADKLDRLPHAINDIVTSIMETVDALGFVPPADPPAVPIEKFDFNNIPPVWKRWLSDALADAPTAWDSISQFGNPEAANVVPEFFRTKYLELRLANRPPGQILHELHKLIVGGVRSLDTDGMRTYAGYVMLATMFETCQIFEEKQVSRMPEELHDITL